MSTTRVVRGAADVFVVADLTKSSISRLDRRSSPSKRVISIGDGDGDGDGDEDDEEDSARTTSKHFIIVEEKLWWELGSLCHHSSLCVLLLLMLNIDIVVVLHLFSFISSRDWINGM